MFFPLNNAFIDTQFCRLEARKQGALRAMPSAWGRIAPGPFLGLWPHNCKVMWLSPGVRVCVQAAPFPAGSQALSQTALSCLRCPSPSSLSPISVPFSASWHRFCCDHVLDPQATCLNRSAHGSPATPLAFCPEHALSFLPCEQAEHRSPQPSSSGFLLLNNFFWALSLSSCI